MNYLIIIDLKLEFKDPSEELTNDLSKQAFYLKLKELKENMNLEINKNKNDKSLIQAARDLKRNHYTNHSYLIQ